MQKITLKYVLWKVVIYILLTVMTLPISLPASMIMKNALDPALLSKILSAVSFILFLFLQNWIIGRSDLSHIKRSTYLSGECLVYALLTLAGALTAALVSGGLRPKSFSYAFVPFFPYLSFSLLCEFLPVGVFLQIALYAAAILLFYTLKKKRNPALTARSAGTAQNLPDAKAENGLQAPSNGQEEKEPAQERPPFEEKDDD